MEGHLNGKKFKRLLAAASVPVTTSSGAGARGDDEEEGAHRLLRWASTASASTRLRTIAHRWPYTSGGLAPTRS